MTQTQAAPAPAADRPGPGCRPRRASRHRPAPQRGRAAPPQPAAGARRRWPACCSRRSTAGSRCCPGTPTGRPPTTPSSWSGSRTSSPRCFRADALATTAFLTGGLEPPEQRAAYDAAIETSPARSPTRPRRSPPTARRWPTSTPPSPTTTPTIAQARANNRQGFPVGAPTSRRVDRRSATPASRLRDPDRQALVAANAERAEDELGGQHPFLAPAAGPAGPGAALRGSTASSRGGSGAGSTSGSSPRPAIVGAVTVLVAVATPRSSTATTTTCATAAYNTVVRRGHRPDRGQRRQGQREPAADLPRLGGQVYERQLGRRRRPSSRTTRRGDTRRCGTTTSTLHDADRLARRRRRVGRGGRARHRPPTARVATALLDAFDASAAEVVSRRRGRDRRRAAQRQHRHPACC